MTNLIYYARKQYIKNGVAGSNERFGTQDDMEYQYHLYCANSVKNTDGNDVSQVEWGSIEHGMIESKIWKRVNSELEPEEPEENDGV